MQLLAYTAQPYEVGSDQFKILLLIFLLVLVIVGDEDHDYELLYYFD